MDYRNTPKYSDTRSSLIWVHTVCIDLSVRKLKIITVSVIIIYKKETIHDTIQKESQCLPQVTFDYEKNQNQC